MNRIFTLAGVALAALFVGVAGMGMTATSAKAQAAKITDVRVVNATAQPVPTTLQGTNVVSIGNSPSVNVANTPNVAVTSLPAVQVGNDNNSPVPVTVTNLPSNDSGRTYVTLRGFAFLYQTGAANGNVFFTVPQGKRLIVTCMSAKNQKLPVGDKFVYYAVFDQIDTHSIPIQHQGTDAEGKEYCIGSFTGQIVFGAGSELSFGAVRSSTASEAAADVTVNGYLENQ
jgi:hypothetical protein